MGGDDVCQELDKDCEERKKIPFGWDEISQWNEQRLDG